MRLQFALAAACAALVAISTGAHATPLYNYTFSSVPR